MILIVKLRPNLIINKLFISSIIFGLFEGIRSKFLYGWIFYFRGSEFHIIHTRIKKKKIDFFFLFRICNCIIGLELPGRIRIFFIVVKRFFLLFHKYLWDFVHFVVFVGDPTVYLPKNFTYQPPLTF